MKTKKAKKPTDATMRNVRAANRKFEQYQQWLEALTLGQNEIYARLERLEHGVKIFSISDKAKKAARRG